MLRSAGQKAEGPGLTMRFVNNIKGGLSVHMGKNRGGPHSPPLQRSFNLQVYCILTIRIVGRGVEVPAGP